MLPNAATDRILMNEHAYYSRGYDEPSSSMQSHWLVVLAFLVAIIGVSKMGHATYLRLNNPEKPKTPEPVEPAPQNQLLRANSKSQTFQSYQMMGGKIVHKCHRECASTNKNQGSKSIISRSTARRR
ncbi:hypothetical protein JCM33374_g2601 [Metschnikowia sp. JCM 33374]|nr:hypothetical protein JCM33374_g2601 [Metschnikowia sp. JCM 33374]